MRNSGMDSGVGRSALGWALALLVVAGVFALGFAAGSASPWRLPEWKWAGQAVKEEPLTPDAALTTLEEERGRLQRYEAELLRVMQEARVAMHLLRTGGQGETPACREQE